VKDYLDGLVLWTSCVVNNGNRNVREVHRGKCPMGKEIRCGAWTVTRHVECSSRGITPQAELAWRCPYLVLDTSLPELATSLQTLQNITAAQMASEIENTSDQL
jgi:hypothetical protein